MKKGKIIKGLAGLLVVLTITAGVLFYLTYQRLKDIQPDILLDQDKAPRTYVTYNGAKYHYNENLVTLMLIGIDESSAEGRVELGARSDTMVVLAIDLKANTLKMIICPRDSKATIRQTDATGKVTGETVNKLNASFPYGGGNQNKDRGAQNVMYCVSRLLSCNGKYTIPLLKYGGINMDGVGPLTTAVGGVTVTLHESITGVGASGQTVKLNAAKAEIFCIERKIAGMDGTDISRGKRQMQFMMGLAKAVKAMEVTQVPSIYSKVSKYSFTNLSTEEIVAYAKLLQNVDLDQVTQVQLAGKSGPVGGGSGWIVDQAEMEKAVIDTFYVKGN